MSRSVLVTGARGYVGGRLVRYLVERGYRVVGTSRQDDPPPVGWPDVAQLVVLDALDPDPAVLRGVDAIIHLAAANEWRSAAEPAAALMETAGGTKRLLDAAIAATVKRFIFFSTIHVYGAPLKGALSEDCLPKPIHPYAVSHLAGELFVASAHMQGQIEGVVIRLSNGIGAPAWREIDRWTLLGNDLAVQAVRDGALMVRTPDQWRDFITLEDVCQGTQILLDVASEALGEGVFNLGGERHRAGMLGRRIATRASLRLGRNIPISFAVEEMESCRADFDFLTDRLKTLGYRPGPESLLDREIDDTLDLLIGDGIAQ